TEQKETEDRLLAATLAAKEAQENAEKANRAKDDFISMVSHELRTPLNTMRLWVRLLGNEALPAKDRGEGLQTLERAVLAQQQLIDDLLDVARMSAGKLRIELRPHEALRDYRRGCRVDTTDCRSQGGATELPGEPRYWDRPRGPGSHATDPVEPPE